MVELVRVDESRLDAVRDLLERSVGADGSPSLSEHKEFRVAGSADSIAVASVAADGDLSAYAQAAWHRAVSPEGDGHWAVEIVLDPGLEHDGDAVASLLAELRSQLPPGERVAVWSTSVLVTDGLLRSGYREKRRLLRLSRPLPFDEKIEIPGGVKVTRFRPGIDDARWLALNNAAFAGHPENGALVEADLAARLHQEWFDVNGFLVAWERSEMVGSCWTKLHDHGVGEIYIIAVHPDHHGRGLGRMLILSGGNYLAVERQATKLMLYVEGDNEAALRLYRGLGFETERVTLQFESVGSP